MEVDLERHPHSGRLTHEVVIHGSHPPTDGACRHPPGADGRRLHPSAPTPVAPQPTSTPETSALDAPAAPVKAAVTGPGNIDVGAFAFADAARGWTAAGGKILATVDGCQTWHPVGSLGGIRRMAFPTVIDGWALTDSALYAKPCW